MIKLCEDVVSKNVRFVVFLEFVLMIFFFGFIINKQEDLDKFFELVFLEDFYGIIYLFNGKFFFDKVVDFGIDIFIGYGE